MAPIAAYRAVPLLDGGAIGDVHYVMEPVIRGRHPRDMAERRAASVELIGSLTEAYMASGLEDLRDDAGCWWLTDWEQARLMPVAFDLGKLLLATGDLGATGGAAAPALRAYDGAGVRRYRWKHQIALGVCLMLSMSVARARRATRVGRQAAMASQTTQHVRWLAQLLDD